MNEDADDLLMGWSESRSDRERERNKVSEELENSPQILSHILTNSTFFPRSSSVQFFCFSLACFRRLWRHLWPLAANMCSVQNVFDLGSVGWVHSVLPPATATPAGHSQAIIFELPVTLCTSIEAEPLLDFYSAGSSCSFFYLRDSTCRLRDLQVFRSGPE